MRPRLRLILVLTLVLGWSRPAWAGASTVELAAARDHFGQGDRHQKQGDWQLALTSYRHAAAIKETPGLLFRIGYCEQQLAQLVEAGQAYQRAAELIRIGMRADDVTALLPEAIAGLKQRTPLVTVLLSGTQGEATLEIDDRAFGAAQWGQPIPLNPGVHGVSVIVPGHPPYQHELSLKEGERHVLEVALAAKPESLGSARAARVLGPESNAETGSLRTAVVAGESGLMAAGLALGLVSIWEQRLAERSIASQRRWFNAQSDSNAVCRGEPPSAEYAGRCGTLREAIDKRRTASATAVVGFATAGVGAAAVLGTVLLWPKGRLSGHATLGSDGGGFVLGGRF